MNDPNNAFDGKKKRVIRLDDLDWEDEVVGGSGKLFFGERPDTDPSSGELAPRVDRTKGPQGK